MTTVAIAFYLIAWGVVGYFAFLTYMELCERVFKLKKLPTIPTAILYIVCGPVVWICLLVIKD